MIRSSKLPRDTDGRATEIMRPSSERSAVQKPSDAVSEYVAQIGRKGGLESEG